MDSVLDQKKKKKKKVVVGGKIKSEREKVIFSRFREVVRYLYRLLSLRTHAEHPSDK